MRRWWTSDLHLTHGNIIGYCQRPFRDAEHMRASIVREFNQRIKPEDAVVHIGDLGTRGRERGVDGPRGSPMDALREFNGRWTLIEGNHDSGNRVKTVGSLLLGTLGPYRFVAHHTPMSNDEVPMPVRDLCRSMDVCLCGHVHQHWRTQWLDGLLHINVGVDVNKFRPLDDSELIGIVDKERRK
jgi:calcineurin-like phosphoesterase family protein